jgi:pyridoxine 5-phosphate synthase
MFASSFQTENQSNVSEIYRLAGEKLATLKIGINAGHDLNLNNVGLLRQELPYLAEVSIGHALFCEAIYLGLQKTISQYLENLQR